MATSAVSVTFNEGSAPATPASTKVVTYAKSDGLMYSKDDAGVETLMSGGAGGAAPPDCAHFPMVTNVTMGAANTWTDSGMSLALTTGTWLVEATLMLRVTQTGLEFIAARLIESGGSSTIYATVGMNLLSNNGQEIPLVVRRRLTFGSTTTVKVQGMGLSRTGVLVADASAVPPLTNDLISYMTALKVTSI